MNKLGIVIFSNRNKRDASKHINNDEVRIFAMLLIFVLPLLLCSNLIKEELSGLKQTKKMMIQFLKNILEFFLNLQYFFNIG